MTFSNADHAVGSEYGGTVAKREQWKPVATYTLMGITIAIYLLQMLSQFTTGGGDYPAAIGMKVNNLIIQGQFWRLITPLFLHASLLHIGFNMYALYVLGVGLERFYGRGRYLALYFLSGFAGNVASFIFSASPSLGASTAIFGLLGAEGVLFYHNREIFGAMAQRSLINVIMIAAINLVIGLSPGIDNWGHMGGLVGGIIFAWIAGPRYQRQSAYLSPGVVDTRESGDTIRAGLLVGVLFAIIAGIKIYFSS
jgi:rhomboid protease GluP